MKFQKKILIIKIGAIGDVVLALPLIHAFENASITWVIGKASSSIIFAIDAIDNIVVINEKKLLEGNIFSKLLEVLKIWKKLFLKRFDLVITAHRDPRYRLLSKLCFKKNHRFFDVRKDDFPLGSQFHSLEYLKLALNREVGKEEITLPRIQLPSIKHLLKISNKEKIFLLSPGGDKNDPHKSLRMWPIEYYVELAKLLQKYNYTLGLIGLKQDEWISSYFKDFLILNFIGKTSLLEVITLLSNSFAVITHDGGVFHLARLAGSKRCGIFGPTSPKDFALESEEEIFFWGGDGLNCRPCYNGKTFKKCSHQSCMKQIKPEQVLEKINKKWSLLLT